MRFDVIVKNKTPVVESHPTTRTLDQFHRMIELVKRVESMIAAEHFLPNEGGMYCAGCPHQAACKAWHRAEARQCIKGCPSGKAGSQRPWSTKLSISRLFGNRQSLLVTVASAHTDVTTNALQ